MSEKNMCGAATPRGHPLDEHRGQHGCVDGCGCTWLPGPVDPAERSSEALRGAIVALGSGGTAPMLDELLRRAAAGGSATDHAVLRDRIREALWAANGPAAAEEANVDAVLAVLAEPAAHAAGGAAADAVLAVADAEQQDLRATLDTLFGMLRADRAQADGIMTGLRAERDEARTLAARRESKLISLRAKLGQARTTRATALTEAADLLDCTDFPDDAIDLFDNGARWATAELRRLAVAAADPTGPAPEPEVVAYRNSHQPGVLLCRGHGAGWMGLTPLTSEDLPDGGACTWDGCGVDVLIPQPGTAPATDGEAL